MVKKLSIFSDRLADVWTPTIGQFVLTDFDEVCEVHVSDDVVDLDYDLLRHRGQQRHRLTFIKNKKSSQLDRSSEPS